MIWPTVSLRDICEFKYGKSLPASSRDGGRFGVFGSNGLVGSHSVAITDGPTVVIGRKGSIGELNYSDASCWPIDTTYFVDRSCTESDIKWLTHAMAMLGLTKLNKAAAIPGLNRNDAYEKKLILPPLSEQRRIAAILDTADALRAKRREVIANLDQLLRCVFLDMFGDPVTNPKGWPEAPLSKAVNEGTIVTYGIVQAGEEFPGGVPYIRTGDITGGQIVEAGLRRTNPEIAKKFARSRVEAGDIVMSIRATVGTTAIVPESLDGANLTQGTARIAVGKKINRDFALHHLRSAGTQRWIQKQVKGATFREITLGRLRELPLMIPPRGLQDDFGRICEHVNRNIEAAYLSQNHLEQLFISLQQRAFTGTL